METSVLSSAPRAKRANKVFTMGREIFRSRTLKGDLDAIGMLAGGFRWEAKARRRNHAEPMAESCKTRANFPG